MIHKILLQDSQVSNFILSKAVFFQLVENRRVEMFIILKRKIHTINYYSNHHFYDIIRKITRVLRIYQVVTPIPGPSLEVSKVEPGDSLDGWQLMDNGSTFLIGEPNYIFICLRYTPFSSQLWIIYLYETCITKQLWQKLFLKYKKTILALNNTQNVDNCRKSITQLIINLGCGHPSKIRNTGKLNSNKNFGHAFYFRIPGYLKF